MPRHAAPLPVPRAVNHARAARLAAALGAAPAPPRRVVVVLGMHRSGTSLAARAVQALGASLGGPLMPGNASNPDGHFEHLDIVAAHEAGLAGMGVAWDACWSALPAPPSLSQRRAAALRDRLAAVLARELAQTSGLFAFKDPRTLRLLPHWIDLLQRLSLAPVWLLCLRDPRAVAASLFARDAIPHAVGEWLWLEHVLEALCRLGARLACVIVYERWLEAPETQMAALAQALGVASCASPFRAELNHEKPQGAPALPAAMMMYEALAAPGADLEALQVQARALRREMARIAGERL
jgi:hypothetical protein